MPTLQAGIIKSITLPDSFAKGESLHGGRGTNWRKVFHPRNKRDTSDVSISAFFRGRAVIDDEAKAFRVLLRQPPGVVFSAQKDTDCCHPQAESIIKAMIDALGQAGNNQLTNQERGIFGPHFFLQRMETVELKKRKVMIVYGIFHDAEMNPLNHYVGLFVDADPNSSDCRIEELVFEAFSNAQYEKCRPDFEKALKSIVWN